MWNAISAALGLVLCNAPLQTFSLENALRRVDAAYPKLISLRQEIASAEAKAREKGGAFDPIFTVSSDFLRYNSASAPGSAYEWRQHEAAVEFVTDQGLKIAIGSRLNFGKVKSPASATGDLGESFVALKVPLLRNWGSNEKSVGRRQALQAIELAKLNVAANRLEILRSAGLVYWDYASAVEKQKIAKDLLDLAVERARALGARVEAGDLPEIDKIEAQTEVKRREGALIKADRDLQKSAIKLKLYLGSEPAIATPTLRSLTSAPDPADAEPMFRAALANRPEVRALSPARTILDLALNLAQNERRPNLELTLGPGLDPGANGIGGTLKLGFVYSAYLRQNTADGRIGDAQAKIRKFEAEADLLCQTIRNEVEDANSAVQTTDLRVIAAGDELLLAQRLEQGERDRFALGEGTLFLLNQRERATAEAAARLIDTLAERQQARLALRAAIGDL